MNDLSQNNQSASNRPDCDAIAPLLDCYHDNEIDDAERLEVEKHLVSCPACTSELANIASLVQKLKGLPPAHSEIDFADRIEKQILSSKNGNVVAISRSRKWLVPVAAAAAVIVTALVGMQITNGGLNGVTVASSDVHSAQNFDSRESREGTDEQSLSTKTKSIDVNQKQNLVAIANPVQSNIAEELGIKTDEDGLYAIKM